MKPCSKCRESRPLDEFPKLTRSRDGREGVCKVCRRKTKNAWTAANRDHVNAKARAFIARHRERINAKAKERYKENPEKYRAHVKAYRARRPWAKREYEWKLKYGISRADYDRMLLEQGGGCAICGATPSDPTRPRDKVLHVDHDHVTGVVRGLLCNQHNRALGLFADDPELLQRAIGYLAASRYWLPLQLKAAA
jgi:hypothetical protein